MEQKFTGQQRDEESQLDYFNARYYGGALGRFTSPDPGNAGADLYNPQSWNGYSYVANNPLIYTDPSGMDFQSFLSGVGNLFTNLGSAFNNYFNPPCGSEFCSTTVEFNNIQVVSSAGPGLTGGGGGGNGGGSTGGGGASGGGGVKFVTTVFGQSPSSPPGKNPPLAPCESAILNAVNGKFKTCFTTDNVADTFRYSAGAPFGKGTLNLNFAVPAAMQPTRVSIGRYPVNPATNVLGTGSTLHILQVPVEMIVLLHCGLAPVSLRHISIRDFRTIQLDCCSIWR